MSTYLCNVKKDLKFQDLICFFQDLLHIVIVVNLSSELSTNLTEL